MLYNIMSFCWAPEPKERPDFDKLIDDFQCYAVQDTDYINLNMIPE